MRGFYLTINNHTFLMPYFRHRLFALLDVFPKTGCNLFILR